MKTKRTQLTVLQSRVADRLNYWINSTQNFIEDKEEEITELIISGCCKNTEYNLRQTVTAQNSAKLTLQALLERFEIFVGISYSDYNKMKGR